MVLEHLELVAFKSIATASCDFAPKLNCFFGGNGMGKTNLLDAIHYLSMARSHLNTVDRLAIRIGSTEAVLSGDYRANEGEEPDRIALRLRMGQAKALSRNGRLYKRLSEHIGRYPLVIISPQDYRLIRGGSDERRNWLDRLLSQHDALYLDLLIRYDRALQQRNTLLKSDFQDEMLLSIVEEQMALTGVEIAQKRAEFVRDFTPTFNQLYQEICGDKSECVTLNYLTATAPNRELFTQDLRQRRREERATGYTTYGIHKDDLEMLLGENLMRKIGSEGQNKTFLTALKFTEYNLLANKLQCRPILLLDDLFDKLDAERVERIIGIVSRPIFGQIFITDTNRKYLDDIIEAQHESFHLYAVDHGNIALQATSH